MYVVEEKRREVYEIHTRRVTSQEPSPMTLDPTKKDELLNNLATRGDNDIHKDNGTLSFSFSRE